MLRCTSHGEGGVSASALEIVWRLVAVVTMKERGGRCSGTGVDENRGQLLK